MFCTSCRTPISNAGRCLRCYPEWHAYGNGFPQPQMGRGPIPQPAHQSQFMAPMPPVQYQPMPQPRVMHYDLPTGYADRYGPNVFGLNRQPYTPNFEQQYNPVNTITRPVAGTLEVARVPHHAVTFEIDDEAEDMMKSPEELLMPRALQENWSRISERQHRIQSNLLEQNQTFYQEYMRKMVVSGYMNADHRQLVVNTISKITCWLTALNDLRSKDSSRQKNTGAASRLRYVDKKHSFVVRSVPGQPQFETGIIDQDWRLGDIRRKRFINSGVQCSKCAGGEADHPERTHNEMYEIFSYFVERKLVDKKKWCQICMKHRFTKKARLHRTDQHDLGMWYDHPDNDFDKLGQYRGWKHAFPSKELKWKPKPVAQMFKDMRRAQMPTSAYA